MRILNTDRRYMPPIDIYYDGLHLSKYAHLPFVKGFTTNCTIFATDSDKHYTAFYEKNREFLKGRPFSFQIWEDDEEKAKAQIDAIATIDPSIFIKIPILTTEGRSNRPLLEYAVSKNLPINVTALHTMDQIETAYECLKSSVKPAIISVFAGPISDIGVDPTPFLHYAVTLFRNKPLMKILFAGAREPYSIQRAEQAGCHIITIPDAVIEKLLVSKTLEDLTLERVQKFHKDAVQAGIKI